MVEPGKILLPRPGIPASGLGFPGLHSACSGSQMSSRSSVNGLLAMRGWDSTAEWHQSRNVPPSYTNWVVVYSQIQGLELEKAPLPKQTFRMVGSGD